MRRTNSSDSSCGPRSTWLSRRPKVNAPLRIRLGGSWPGSVAGGLSHYWVIKSSCVRLWDLAYSQLFHFVRILAYRTASRTVSPQLRAGHALLVRGGQRARSRSNLCTSHRTDADGTASTFLNATRN